ncbi:MAG: hypothetical protein HUK07_07175 [Bacteroidaceae bacterium]|nr:hypothetical protein [Bacteroidaceae bacterium]
MKISRVLEILRANNSGIASIKCGDKVYLGSIFTKPNKDYAPDDELIESGDGMWTNLSEVGRVLSGLCDCDSVVEIFILEPRLRMTINNLST